MADIFNEDGKYNKTDWESGDRITANKLNRIEMAIEQINDNDNQRHIEADGRLDSLEAGLTETKDKVDNIDMAYKTADTVLTNRVNSVETSYKAADTTLNNRVNSVETAYKTSETNLTNKFNNLNTAYQNAVSNLTAKFNSLETAYKAADTKMTNNINNLDAAYKAADVEIQNEINELQNSVPINVSQLINDMNYVTEDYLAGYNLLSNTTFPNKDTYFWNLWNNMRVIESNDSYYYGREGTLCIKSDAIYSDEIQSGILVKLGRGTFYHNKIIVEPETAYTFSFYCKWEENIAGCDYFIEYYDENMEVIEDVTDIWDMKELENDFNKRQSITFTTPQNAYYVICGFGHDGVITADIGNNAIFINKPAIKKGTSDVWSPESVDVNPGKSWGHCVLPGGLLLQWGITQIFYSQSGGTTGEAYASYPIKYSAFSVSYVNLQGVNADVSVESTNYILASHSSPDGVSIRFRDYRNDMAFAYPNNVVVNWFAIGK